MGASSSREEVGDRMVGSTGYAPFPPQSHPQAAQPPYDPAGPSYAAAYEHYVKQGIVHPGAPILHARGEWHAGLCDCLTDVPTCTFGCICPCLLFGRNVEIIDRGQTACIAASLLWYILQQFCCCGCIYACWYRRALRNAFNIPGDTCEDCCAHLLCFPCAICQETREIDHRSKFTSVTPPTRQAIARTRSF